MITEIMIYFALGIVGDLLVTLYYLFVGKLQGVPASLLTIVITLLNFFVIEKVVVTTNWAFMLIYAVGSAVGCFSIIAFEKARTKKTMEKQNKNARKRR